MAQSKIKRALGAVKDKTSIGLAKVGSSNSISDLDVAIVKATRHDEHPAEERHIREILTLTTYSRAYVNTCVNTLAKRLNKTRNWTVALKTLILIHRLLAEGDPTYEQEIFFATRRGTRMLNMSDFRDNSRSNSWDFSAFVRTYALYLDERLEYKMQGRRNRRNLSTAGSDDEENNVSSNARSTPVREMRLEKIFARMQHLQQLLERFLACRPTGAAKCHRIVIVALYPVVKESIQIYYDIMEIMGILIEQFTGLEVPDCVRVFEIFSRAGKQLDELDLFYNWCKSVGIVRSSEYPDIEKITSKKLEIMDEFIKDKSTSFQTKKIKNNPEPIPSPETETETEKTSPTGEEAGESQMTAIKALPAPEISSEATQVETEIIKQTDNAPGQGDLLNLTEDVTVEEQGDKLALALFAVDTATPPTWEAFTENDEAADWESALVESASNLMAKKAELGGGFDLLLLDGMYEKAATMGGSTSIDAGSASSVAVTPGYLALPAPGYLALPAPPVATSSSNNIDPFAASLAVAPPAYVQMSEMEKKQQFLVEEQLMWQQYARDGMQGQLGMTKLQQNTNPYGMGGYT